MTVRRCGMLIALFAAVTALGPAAGAAHAGSDADLGSTLDVSGAASSGTTSSTGFSLKGAGSTEGLAPQRLSAALSGVGPDRLTTRGLVEMRVYATTAPGVVLVVTNDSLGSGSILTSDGLVITNLHVVGDNREVGVIVKPKIEGTKVGKTDIRRAIVVRRDQVADLALLKIATPPPGLSPIALGIMANVAVGADVHAIGHPTGEAWTYTKGIVSQVRSDYRWKAEDGVPHMALVIQTQTPINPGNSGGPLLTDNGQLIGVNSFKGQGEGLNFAVSVDDVRRILNATVDRLGSRKTASAPKPAGECEPKFYGKKPLKDEPGTSELVDLSCQGKPDAILIIPEDASKPIRLLVDAQRTGKISGVYVSHGRDFKWDESYWDTSGGGQPDVKCYHTNGKIEPTRCEKYAG